MRKTTVLPLLALLVLLGGASTAFAGDRPDKIILAAKEASGGSAWDRANGLHLHGRIVANGLSGNFDDWIDLRGMRETSMFELGPSSGGQGWDGKRFWSIDSSRDVRIETSHGSIAAAIQHAYRDTFAFFFPDRVSATRAFLGQRSAGGETFDIVRITPRGTDPFDLWINANSHLIAREVQVGGEEAHTFIFSDWRKVGAIFLPFRTIQRTANAKRFDMVYEVTKAELTGPLPARRFAPPEATADPARWPEGKTSVTVPFELLNNHIYLRASIDGKPPVRMIFDTGATDILDAGHAKALAIGMSGALPAQGIGDKVASYGLAKVGSISIGGLTLRNQVFGVVDLSPILRVEDADASGLVGYEFAKRTVLTVDYANRKLIFRKPGTFHPPAGVPAIPFSFHFHSPLVKAAIDGISGQFELDTGARTGLVIMGPFARNHDLMHQYRATPETTISYGIGGPERARLARLGKLRIGQVTLDAPVAEFTTGTGGDAASSHTAGNIGGDILKRFKITFDYRHRLLWLQPNASASSREVFDRAGIWMSRGRNGAVSVDDVAAHSAASSAGLVIGDEIVAVNGVPATKIALSDLRERFKAEPRTAIELTVRHAGKEEKLRLVLEDQV
ncbi:aspartyl protease family protein [Rhodanobacter ginsengisoli]|uniref:Aspartyl protease family protein n=1 Tax=Rhodanobacter ginsengisoli TaxID=418646 RepID=A0ABW0QPB8_9GAMM